MGVGHAFTLEEARLQFYDFCKARGWDGANSAELVMLLSEEVGEVAKEVRMLHFQHVEDRHAAISRLGDELVDVFNYVCRIASEYDIDLNEAYVRKSQKIAEKYPL